MNRILDEKTIVTADFESDNALTIVSAGVYETPWYNYRGGAELNKQTFKDFCIQVQWEAVAGTTDGIIELIKTIDGLRTITDTVEIDSTSNVADCVSLNKNTICNAIKIRYIANAITSAKLTISIDIL